MERGARSAIRPLALIRPIVRIEAGHGCIPTTRVVFRHHRHQRVINTGIGFLRESAAFLLIWKFGIRIAFQ